MLARVIVMLRIPAVVVAMAIAVTTTSGAATAQPQAPTAPNTNPGDAVSATALPPKFPADLKKFIGGTDEFKQAPWFQGECASRGGDMGAYLSAMLTGENRLLWWGLSDDAKKTYLTKELLLPELSRGDPSAQADVQQKVDQLIADGGEPSPDLLPRVFPAGDASYHPPTGVCADDLKQWASAANNTWGFDWVAPDNESLAAMKAAAGAGKVPEQAWTGACSSSSAALGEYCAHAFFVNCDKADNAAAGGTSAAAAKCRAWNARIGHLFAGTANWIDKNTTLGERIGATVQQDPVWQGGKWVVSALSGLVSVAVQAVKFVADPQGVVDDWANALKQGSIDTSTRILKSLAVAGHFDPASDWFRRIYSVSVALGFILCAFMLVMAVRRSTGKGSPRELAQSLFAWLPLSLFLALFAPGFAALVLQVSTSLSRNLAQLGGPSTGELINHVSGFDSATSANFPGGSLLAIVMFGLMLVGALMIWVGLMVHDFGLPLAGIVSGISIFMLVHPRYRHKALRPVFIFLGLAFSGPTLFLLLWVMFAAANAVYGQNPSTGMGQAAQVFQVALAMVIVGLGPWGLLKWAPILPTAADSEDIGQGSSVIGDTISSAGNAMIFARGGGVGGERPAPRAEGSEQDQQKSTGDGGGGSGAEGTAGAATNPLTRAYQEKSTGEHAVGGTAGSGRADKHSDGEHAAKGSAQGREAGAVTEGAAGVASGGTTLAAAVGIGAVGAAVNKAKSIADDGAPRADDDADKD